MEEKTAGKLRRERRWLALVLAVGVALFGAYAGSRSLRGLLWQLGTDGAWVSMSTMLTLNALIWLIRLSLALGRRETMDRLLEQRARRGETTLAMNGVLAVTMAVCFGVMLVNRWLMLMVLLLLLMETAALGLLAWGRTK